MQLLPHILVHITFLTKDKKANSMMQNSISATIPLTDHFLYIAANLSKLSVVNYASIHLLLTLNIQNDECNFI